MRAERETTDRSVPRALDRAAAWSWRLLLVAAVVWVAAKVASLLSIVLIPIVVALFVAAVLVMPVDWLRDRGLPDLAAVWVVILAAVALLVALVFVLTPVVADELPGLADELSTATDDIKRWLAEGPLGLDERQIESTFDGAVGQLQERFVSSGGALRVVELLGGVLFGLIVAFFVAKDRDAIVDWFVNLFPEDAEPKARRAIDRGWSTLRSYVGGTAVVGVADAVLIGIGLLIVGVPLVIPLMLITFLGAFIPLVGAFVAGMLAALVALAANGVVDALIVVAIVVVVQQVEGDVLAPAVLGRAMKLHPLVILIGVFAGAVVAGVFGAFVAVPAIATVLAVRDELAKDEPADAAEPVEAAA